jgi:hypothetical protein
MSIVGGLDIHRRQISRTCSPSSIPWTGVPLHCTPPKIPVMVAPSAARSEWGRHRKTSTFPMPHKCFSSNATSPTPRPGRTAPSRSSAAPAATPPGQTPPHIATYAREQ